MKIRIVTNKKDRLKYSSRPTFINSIIFGKRLVAIHDKPEEIRLNKPIYVGCAVLEESKLEMYKFYYDFLRQKCNEISLVYMDTVGFIFEVIGETFNAIMLGNKEYFDLSNFSKDSKYYNPTNQKVPGKMKEEYAGTDILEVIAMKPKSYSIKDVNNNETNKHKGHSDDFKHSEYKDTAINKNFFTHSIKKISSLHHKISTIEILKRSLSCFDDKRCIRDDGITTYALGHKNIIKNE